VRYPIGGTWAKEHCVRQGNKFTWSNYDYCKELGNDAKNDDNKERHEKCVNSVGR